ncbi:tRNA preQ1(34) S-adenosylmethionine ribosyltransferase-isomerase QueA [Myxococcota bacterium]|nr:tRNA preQ1(34) S-adenosylmethionine ribosyltransferase-isomerase QueA [Myxococcota bacterium]
MARERRPRSRDSHGLHPRRPPAPLSARGLRRPGRSRSDLARPRRLALRIESRSGAGPARSPARPGISGRSALLRRRDRKGPGAARSAGGGADAVTSEPDRDAIAEAELEAVLAQYDFDLPEALIAQTPLADRTASRLLVVERENGRVLEPDRDHHVRDLGDWLDPGDLIVVNATRVLPARLLGRKASGGLAEALILGREAEADLGSSATQSSTTPDGRSGATHRALLKCTGRVRPGLRLVFRRPGSGPDAPSLAAEVVARFERGEVALRFDDVDADPYSVGIAPLPPYIRRSEADAPEPDLDRYQTVFAREPGAVAAPTAGLHLTQDLLERLAARGIARAEVVLHVGAGTFRPLDVEAWRSGRLHRERFELPGETVAAIERTRAAGGRIVAVGTTTTRVLESRADADGRLTAGRGETDLFLRPGSKLRVVDALLTNFHLPRSSLLMLVASMIGQEAVLEVYRHAIERRFRFFSYGDAMLIRPRSGGAHAG